MAAAQGDKRSMLVITGDDYGYWPSYNQGILEAVEMGGLDCVSVMVEREHCNPEPLLETGVEIGLHIEFEGRWGPRSGAPSTKPSSASSFVWMNRLAGTEAPEEYTVDRSTGP